MAEGKSLLEKAKGTQQSWAGLTGRMDKDRDLYHLEPFKLLDKDGKPMKNVENLTWNDPQTFGARVVSTLNSAEMQTIVESKKVDKKATALIEDFFRLLFLMADERLAARDIVSLRSFHNEMASIRGRLVTRVLLYGDKGDFVPDLVPCDPRFVVYGFGLTGLSWVAVQTWRDPDQVYEEYGVKVETDNCECWDCWDRDVEEVYIDGEKKWGQPNKLGKPPFIITSCTGSLLADLTADKNRAESIYASNRNLYEHLNRTGSVMETEVMKLLKPPMQFKNIQGQQGRAPKQPPYGEGFVIPVGVQEGFENMPRADLTQAGRLLIAMLEQRLQRGALPAVDYGNLTFPLSAVAIKGLQGAKDQIFLPRLQALAIHYRGIARMVREQYTKGGFNAVLRDEIEEREFPTASVDADYSIFFKFAAVNPEQDVANYAIAEAARAFFSDEYIMEHILQVDNPILVKDQKWSELAVKANEYLAKVQMIKSLKETGQTDLAALLANEMETQFAQMKTGGNGQRPPDGGTPKKIAQSSQGKQAVSLMGQGRGPGRPTAGRPAQEQILQAPEAAAAAVGSEE